MYDDDFQRTAILKRPLNFFLLAFYGVIYPNLVHRRVYIAVSIYKLLYHQFCRKPLHITFMATPNTSILLARGHHQQHSPSDHNKKRILIPTSAVNSDL